MGAFFVETAVCEVIGAVCFLGCGHVDLKMIDGFLGGWSASVGRRVSWGYYRCAD